MELLLLLVVALILGEVIGLPIAVILLWQHSNRLDEQLEKLKQDHRRLKTDLEVLRAVGPASSQGQEQRLTVPTVLTTDVQTVAEPAIASTVTSTLTSTTTSTPTPTSGMASGVFAEKASSNEAAAEAVPAEATVADDFWLPDTSEATSRPTTGGRKAGVQNVAKTPVSSAGRDVSGTASPGSAVSRTADTDGTGRRDETHREGGESSLEEIVAGRWLTWVGALALICGAGFFLKYAIDNEWLGPTGRVVLGLIVGMGCFLAGAFAMLRQYTFLAQGLVGAALGILYFSFSAATNWYQLIPRDVAFAGMTLVTAAALAFSVRFDALSTAVLGLIGGFLTPLVLSTGEDAQVALFSYILLLDLGVLGVASYRKWRVLELMAFCGTLLIWFGWYEQHYAPEKLGSTVLLMTLFFVLFALLGIWHNVLQRRQLVPGDFVLILATPIFYFAGIYAVTKADYSFLHGLLSIAIAAAYLGLGLFALARNPRGTEMVVSLAGLAATFLTLAVPLQLSGHWIPIAWAAESLLLVELGLHFQQRKLRVAGFCLLGVVQWYLLMYLGHTVQGPYYFHPELWVMDENGISSLRPDHPTVVGLHHWTSLFNGRSMTFLASAIVLGVLAWEYRRRALAAMQQESADGSAALPVEPGLHSRAAPSAFDESSDAGWTMSNIVPWLITAVPATLLLMVWCETLDWGHFRSWMWTSIWSLSTVWAASAGLVLLALGRGLRMPVLRNPGMIFLLLAGFGLLINSLHTLADWRYEALHRHQADLDWSLPVYWYWFGLNPRGLGYLFTMLAAVWGMYLCRPESVRTLAEGETAGATADNAAAAMPRSWQLTQSWWQAPVVLGLLAYLTGLAMLTVEIYAQGVLREWATATSLAITGMWTAYATCTLVAGILTRVAELRILSLALFVVTTAKVFLYDVWYLDRPIRTVAFMGLGAALMFVSYLYRRYRARIRAWIKPVALMATLLALSADGPSCVLAQEQGGQGKKSSSAETSIPREEQLLRSLKYRWLVTKDKEPSLLEKADAPALLRCELPWELYGEVQPHLGDIRLLARTGETVREIPYVLWNPQDVHHFVQRDVELLNLSQRGSVTTFLLDLGEQIRPVNQLSIKIRDAERNYERSVRVYGTDRRDAEEWNLLTRDAFVMDVTRPQGYRMTVSRIDFPQSKFRFYRIEIENGTQKPLTVESAQLFDIEHRRAPRTQRSVAVLQHEDIPQKRSEVLIDLGLARLPSNEVQLRIEFPGDFHRSYSLDVSEKSNDPRAWQHVTSGQLYRIHRDGRTTEKLNISYGEVTGRYLRLRISNDDDKPLKVVSATVALPQRSLVFRRAAVPQGYQELAVYAGAEGLNTPLYDLRQTIGRLEEQPMGTLELAPREANPHYLGPAPKAIPWSEANRPLLWGATLGGLVIIGGLTVLLLRKALASAPPRE